MVKAVILSYTTEDDVHNFNEAEALVNKWLKERNIKKGDIINIDVTANRYPNSWSPSREYEKYTFTIVYWAEEKKKEKFELYWVSALIYEEGKKPWLLALSDSCIGLDKAMEAVKDIRSKHNVISAWIDKFHGDDVKTTVFHECYVNAFGYTVK